MTITTNEDVLEKIEDLPSESNWRLLCQDPNGEEGDWGRWSAQFKANAFVERYLRYVNHARAALVRMPTGTGKTGVMAVAANYFKEYYARESCLIVVPSKYLTGQIARAINEDYWRRIRKRPVEPVAAVVFLPSTIEEILRKCSGPTAFICTQKALSDIHAEDSRKYAKIKKRIGTVFVDEGHREPAFTWSDAVRSFEKPTVLFSATPYRNDLRMFRIGPQNGGYRFKLTYPKALEVGQVRAIKLEHPQRSFVTKKRGVNAGTRDENRFAKELMRFYEEVVLKRKPKSIAASRVIVRCHGRTSVEKVQDALRKVAGRRFKGTLGDGSIIAIHEDFAGKESEWRFKQPPAPGDIGSDAVFWVHQFKLVEGIDNNEFCCVAFYEPFDNARSLVQQIGRIVRNKSEDETEKAFVFSDKIDRLDEQWAGYLAFEEADQDIIGAEDIVESIRSAQPKWFYAERKYRQGVDFGADDYWDDIRLPATTQVYIRPPGYNGEKLGALANLVRKQIEMRDVTHVRTVPRSLGNGKQCVTSFYWKISQSGHFSELGFFDINLLVAHCYMNDAHIFYQGLVKLETCEADGPEKIEVDNLLSALPDGDSQIKELSLINSDLGDMAVRRRNIGGRSLEFASAALNDHLHFVTACISSHTGGRRYVGFNNARITDAHGRPFSLPDYHAWLDSISEVLLETTAHRRTPLRRFAPAVRKPSAAKARHLLLDLNEFVQTYEAEDGSNVAGSGFTEAFEATACDVEDDGNFECEIRGKTFRGKISYTSGKFRVTSDDLNEVWRRQDGSRMTAASFLSSSSVMRVVTEKGHIYSDGRFYSPARLRGAHRFTDLNIFVGVGELGNITKNEKGDTGCIGPGTWQEGSIFHIIDQGTDLFNADTIDPNILVCDDPGTEIADFIAIDEDTQKKCRSACQARQRHGKYFRWGPP